MSENNFRREKEKMVAGPDPGLIPGQTGRLTVGHKIILILTLITLVRGLLEISTLIQYSVGSMYLAGNTSRLRYRAQPVIAVWGKNRCLL
jgi:hypothetical protein